VACHACLIKIFLGYPGRVVHFKNNIGLAHIFSIGFGEPLFSGIHTYQAFALNSRKALYGKR